MVRWDLMGLGGRENGAMVGGRKEPPVPKNGAEQRPVTWAKVAQDLRKDLRKHVQTLLCIDEKISPTDH